VIRTLTRYAALAAAFAAPCALAQQQDMDKVEIGTEKVADGIYMLTGFGGNIGVSVGADGVAIVDDQFAPLVPKIQAAIAKLSPTPVQFVINTHWHPDHTGGNEPFGAAGAVIVAHDNVYGRMSVEQVSGLSGRVTPASPRAALPVVTFPQAMRLRWNDEQIDVWHVDNAHTDGDAIVRFQKANVVHLGDLYFQSFYPFIDTSSGGSVDGLVRALDSVLPTLDANTRIIPGHGAVTGKAGLEEYRTMIVTIRDRIAKLIAEGKSQDEVLAAAPSREFDARWGAGFIKPNDFVARLYVDLKRKAAVAEALRNRLAAAGAPQP